jgi:DeoR/GlpR family transcriptional regulator of sugar metabolism
MLKEERFDHILHKLASNRKVTLGEISSELEVSEDTVRRDIEALSKNGQLTKVRGGAIPHSPNAGIHAFKDRIHVSETDKVIIAKKALNLLKPGQTILLDGGTTTYKMAGMLPHDIVLTVVTNNLPIAALLTEHPSVEVIMAGGKIFKSSQVTIGMEAIRLLSSLRVDICFTGICSLHEEFGISSPDMDETEVKRVMVRSANRVVAVTTLDKIGTAEPYNVCGIGSVETIITEADPDRALFAPYRALGINIL